MNTKPDIIISDAPLSPFDADELGKIQDLINHLQGGTVISTLYI